MLMLHYIWMVIRGYRMVCSPEIDTIKGKIVIDDLCWVKTTKRGVHIEEVKRDDV